MTALLDTHVFLWAIRTKGSLSVRAKAVLEAPGTFLLSHTSLWEVVIKAGRGKLNLPRPVMPFLVEQAALNRVQLLPIRLGHLEQLERLPLLHRDPFDRLLVSQALAEGIALISADGQLSRYGVEVIW
ncbi:MAG: type II toxin-antitoxin system VapC family toxin [Terriglobales bacterium]